MSTTFVSGKVPNWLQPKSGQYNATMGGYESQFLAWCSPTSAANQLGHLVDHGGVTQPTNINDGIDAGNDSPVALASSTIAWDSGYGWGDYMLDGPTYRAKNLFNGTVTDFGWYMNTNDLGPLGAGAGSPVGSTLQNIYHGMVDFYQQVGYTNMVGMVYHFNGSIQNFGVDPAFWTANGHTAASGISADYTLTLETIKHEITNNRTVIACFNGWNITPTGHPDASNMNGDENETGIYQTLGEFQPDGPHGEQFNTPSTEGGNIESYNAGLGHTVLIVGYIPAGAAEDPTGTTEWLVVRDNYTTTHKNVIIPFANLNNLLATVYVNHTTATYNAITIGGTDYSPTTEDTEIRQYPPDYVDTNTHAIVRVGQTYTSDTDVGYNFSKSLKETMTITGQDYGNGVYNFEGNTGDSYKNTTSFTGAFMTNKSGDWKCNRGGAGNTNNSVYPPNGNYKQYCRITMPTPIKLKKVFIRYTSAGNAEVYIYGTNSTTTNSDVGLTAVFRSWTGSSPDTKMALDTNYTWEATDANSATRDYLANNDTYYKYYWVFVNGTGGITNHVFEDIHLYGSESVFVPTPVTFTNNILTIENSIDATDTDVVSFDLPTGTEMASLNVTNFSGSGTISYTISATGATDITGTISAIGDNLLADNLLVANAGADITYTLRLTADAAITYTIVGTRTVDYNSITSNYIFDSAAVNFQGVQGSGERFGYSVSVSGNYAIVGAYEEDSNLNGNSTGASGSGAAYIYEYENDTWTQKAFVKASNNAEDTFFGYSVAISGDYAAIGAYREDTTQSLSGAMYIVERNANGDWGIPNTGSNTSIRLTNHMLKATVPGDGDYLGNNVAISGNYAIAGAYNEDSDGTGASNNDALTSGAAYIFERDANGNWSQKAYLKANVIDVDDFFGGSVAIDGNYAAVGAQRESSNTINDPYNNDATNSGAAYIFERDSNGVWEQKAYLKAAVISATGEHYYFGHSVAISGNYFITGARETGTGCAYIFERDANGTWSEKQKLLASNADDEDFFGWNVSIDGDYALIGADKEDSGTTDPANNDTPSAGAMYLFYRNNLGVWTETNLFKQDPIVAGRFGYNVSVSGPHVIGGAYTVNANDGMVSIFSSSSSVSTIPFLSFSTDDILTIENSIDTNDTDAVDFQLIAGEEMASLNVTNFSGTGTISYTISATGVTTITGTIVDGIVTVDGNAIGTNMLANNLLIANAGVDITYTLTLTASAAITYTIVGTKNEDIPTGFVEREYPPAWVRQYILDNTATKAANSEWTGTDVSFTLDDANEPYGQGTYTFGCTHKRFGTGAADDRFNMTNAFDDDLSPYSGAWFRGWYSYHGTKVTNAANVIGNWIDLENGNATGTEGHSALIIEFPESFQPTKFKFWASLNQQPSNQYLYGYDEANSRYDKLHHSTHTWSTYAVESYEHNITQTTPKSYKKYAITAGNNNSNIWSEIRLTGLAAGSVVPTEFNNNILTIQNSISQNDTDVVSFTLPVGDEMHQLVVTNYAGTGAVNYEITTGETTIKSGTISNVGENTAIGTNLLDGKQLTSAIGSTYQLNLTATAPISYTILGTKVTDYGDSSTPTTLVFTNDVLTIDNVTSTTETDVIDFVLPAGYNIPELNVTNFNGTGDVTYTLATGGNTIANGTFSAISSNLLQSGFPIFALSTDVTYVLTITTTATIGYTIVGTRGVTNLSNYSITHFLSSGLTEQQLIDGGIWDADSNANRFNPTYTEGFLDISGNVKVTDNILMDTGDVDLHSFTYTDPYAFTADVPISNRLFVVGDVSMGDASLNIVGDISINGVMSVGSYKSGSISNTAVIPSSGYSTANSITTFTEDIAYIKKIQFNGDISLNMHNDPLVPNPNSTTYFGANTTLKANTGIEFPDSTTLHTTNKEANGTTFKASTFNNMTVVGDFASNPQLTPSDYRIKNNVETLDETHIVDNLRPVKYKQTQTGKNDIGFLAHELQEHYPELVEGEKDGDKMQSVNYSGLLPILINEVQQLKKQIAETRARIHSETS